MADPALPRSLDDFEPLPVPKRRLLALAALSLLYVVWLATPLSLFGGTEVANIDKHAEDERRASGQ